MRLALRLNPSKTILQPIERGIDFVGHQVLPWRRVTRRRTVNNASHRLERMPPDRVFEAANSYFGLLRQASRSHHDRCRLGRQLLKRLDNPYDNNGGSFTGPSLEGPCDLDHWGDRMMAHVNDYLRHTDAIPHHFQMHFMHAVEIVGYKHPDSEIALWWRQLYLRLVNDLHLHPETEAELDGRLGDTREGWLRRADPATAA